MNDSKTSILDEEPMIDKSQKSNDRKLLNEKNCLIAEREIYTDREASEYLRVSQVTLWRERKAGRLTFRRIGGGKIIYLKKDLQEYLENQKRAAYAAN